jgi:hypothetical protein
MRGSARARLGEARQGFHQQTFQCSAGPGSARRGKARQYAARHGFHPNISWQGRTSRGVAGPVLAGPGRAGQGMGSTRLQETPLIDFRITLTGTAPLIMHSNRLSDPLHPATKEYRKITGKRQKTEDDHLEIARMEHAASIYFDPDVGPYIPGENLSRALVDAARITRKGKMVERGVFISTDINPLSYRGPRTIAGLWDDENFRHLASVTVGTKRVMRYRPVFREWSTEADGILDPAVIDLTDLETIAVTAGQMVGLCDWRPRYGRFTARVEKL